MEISIHQFTRSGQMLDAAIFQEVGSFFETNYKSGTEDLEKRFGFLAQSADASV
jgi:hypothetical protein